MSADAYKREYLGIPAGAHTSPFTWELCEQATAVFEPTVRPGEAFKMIADEPAYRIENPFKRFGLPIPG